MTINSDPQLNDADLELLSAYIDHQLDERERIALEQRLSQEPALRGVLGELRATVGLLHELEPLRPPRSFTIAAPAAAPRRFWWFPWQAIGSALVALVCLLTFSYALIRSSGGASQAPAAAPAPAAMEAAAPTQAAVAGGAAPSSAMRQGVTAAPAAEAPTAAPAEMPAAPMAAADSAAPTTAAAAPMAAEAALATPEPTVAAASGAGPVATAQPAAEAPAAAGSAAPTVAAAAAAPADAALKSTEGPVQQPYSALVATSEISSPGTVTLDQPPVAPTANSAPSGGSNNLWLGGIVVLVLLVGAGIGLAIRRRQRM
jgi:hypothetical protein